MNDDWRLRIQLADAHEAGELAEELKAHEHHGVMGLRSMHDRVTVSVDDAEVFCYAGTREQAEEAGRTIAGLAGNHGWQPEVELRHWHPTAEEWEDPDTPLPDTDAARAREHHERVEQERADSRAQGFPEFEVRIKCRSHGHASELADRLRNEGLPVVQRWTAVTVGADDEDSANALAERLRAEAGNEGDVTVEGNLRDIYENGPFRPYAYLGGLGG
jgi:hypothetical protein